MKVRMRFLGRLGEITGIREESIRSKDGATVHDLLKSLSKRYGKAFQDYVFEDGGEPTSHLQILVNGRSITNFQGLKTKLGENVVVAIVPMVGGG